jgi:ribosomal protein S18 acetylase RimI-like enzyme
MYAFLPSFNSLSHLSPFILVDLRLMYRNDDEQTDEQNTEVRGHINSISVLRTYRRLGLAKKLMLLSRTSLPSLLN